MAISHPATRVAKTALSGSAISLALAGAAWAQAAPPPSGPMADACPALAATHLPGVVITQAALQPAGLVQAGPGPGIQLPAHCLVRGAADARKGVGGRDYAIHFEMRLPVAWNNGFLFQGGGGLNGAVQPATGRVKGPAALSRGFAVVTQDAGHDGSDASFGEDQQARIDHTYRSYERVTLLAKQLVGVYYGAAPKRSYFMGCSEGGREALLMAQRMPLEYDGVVAGDPGFELGVMLDEAINRVVMSKIAPRGPDGRPQLAKAFSPADLKLVAARITTGCDGLDGLKDGMIDNWAACRVDLKPLTCKAGKTDSCLTSPQVAALDVVFNGKRNGKGEVVSLGYPYDTSVDQPGWAVWKLGTGPGGAGVSSMQGLFRTPYDPKFDEEAFDVDRDPARMVETGSRMRADAVDYSSFRQHGGKVLIYTGLSDPIFSAKNLIAYFGRLTQANGGPVPTAQFSRLFLVPGMTHCAGGLSLDVFDPLAALVDWVEKDQGPERIVTTGAAFSGRSRPICPYPQQSRYSGQGSTEDERNFVCRVP